MDRRMWSVVLAALLAVALAQAFGAPAESPKPDNGMLEVTYYYLPG